MWVDVTKYAYKDIDLELEGGLWQETACQGVDHDTTVGEKLHWFYMNSSIPLSHYGFDAEYECVLYLRHRGSYYCGDRVPELRPKASIDRLVLSLVQIKFGE